MYICRECGLECYLDIFEISYHGSEDSPDYDMDADHEPIPVGDEEDI